MTKPTVGVAFICNKVGEIEKALASALPHFDQVVVVDTSLDGALAGLASDKVAVHPLLDRSILDENGALLHFAKARQESFAHLTTEWGVWMDSDDTLRDGEEFRLLAAEAGGDVGGYWLPYEYAHDEYGNCITVHSRERMVRLSLGWRWEGRLHETLAPQRPVHWEKRETPRFIHADGSRSRSDRNLRLLALMHEEEPDNIRVWLATGHQHFASRDWPKAIQWYRRFFADERGFHLERWQAMTYAARAYNEMGRFDEAIRLSNAAMLSHPDLADSYLTMSIAYLAKGDPQRARAWAEVSLLKDAPADLVFANPLDYNFHPYNILNIACAAMGDLDHAIQACHDGLRVRPNQRELLNNLAVYEAALERRTQVEAYQALAAGMADSDKVRTARGQGDGFHREPDVRDVWVPAQMRLAKRGTQPECAIVCGHTVSRWAAPTPEKEGLGGSETAVVEIARRMAGAGWRVNVYGRPEELEGWHDGVGYLDARRWRLDDGVDLLVGWRNPALPAAIATARAKWLWLHDLHAGPRDDAVWSGWDGVFGVSRWHADYLGRRYPTLAGRTGALPNGVALDRFTPSGDGHRQRYKCVYTSSPDRGLVNLLKLWPGIRAVEPTAELHIFYGWDNIDAMIAAGDQGMAAFKTHTVKLADQPGVLWRGKVPQKELAGELLTSDLFLYPTSFLETFGINVVEAMAAGLFVVSSRCGAIPETVGDAFPLVPGVAGSPAYNRAWLGLAMAFLVDVKARATYYRNGVARASLWTWDRSFEEAWMPRLREVVTA